jgi:peroxiredoxin
MVVDNGVVKKLNIDAAGTFEKTSAEVMLGEI